MSPDASLKELAEFLCARREDITRRWVDAVRTDPAMATSTKLPHEQLVAHLPLVFGDLAETLGGPHAAGAESAEHAHAHGQHRWSQGFQLIELLRELSILRRIIFVEYLSAFAAEHSDWSAEARSNAETVVHTFFDRISAESAQQYVEATQHSRGQSAPLEAEIARRTDELVSSNKQLRRGEERFKLAVAIAQMGTFEIDLRTDAVVVNEEARQIYGWAPDAPLTFSKVQAQFHPDDREHVLRAVGAAFDAGTESDEFDVEQRIFRTDGEMRWIRVRARAFFEGEGAARQPVVCVGTFLDITERKDHEAAMRESEARFRQLADAIPQLAWMAKPDGWIFWYNQRWHEFTGTTPEEMEGWGWQNVHDPKELPRIIANWKAALAAERPWEDTFPLRRCDGEFRVHLSRANPFRDSRGRVVLWFGTNTDITELVRAEEAAKAANRAKDHFIAVLSHELRTPLTPVLATIMDLNAQVDLPPAVAEAVELIRRNVELEARLIDDLLDVTRISKGKLQMDRQIVPLDSVLRDAIRICESDIRKKRVNVAFELQALNHRVRGDAPRLLQAFWNLLQNAVKFTPAGGDITVRTTGDESRLQVEIADTGIGIEADALPRIFEPFGQADDTISRRFGGLGLGLALSKALVEAHGGNVQAKSGGRDQGTTFTIELDATSSSGAERGSGEPVAAATRAIPSLRILLVEDHEDTRRTLSRLIERWGHTVSTAGTVADALQLATQNRFDLLVSDLGLPDAHGTDLMRELRKTSSIRGVAISGFGTEDDVARSLAAGFELHLAKPVGAQRLQGVIAEIAVALPQNVN